LGGVPARRGALDVDRGHQAPLASFKATTYWADTNYYSNITPQKSDLNQGPWVKIEEMERDLARAGDVVYVMTGPLYERDMPPLPNCDEPHRVPSGYWKIVATQSGDDTSTIRVAAFIFDQDTPRDADPLDYQVAVDEIESRAHLDFMSDLLDDVENVTESSDLPCLPTGNFSNAEDNFKTDRRDK
jgi:endonuclease G